MKKNFNLNNYVVGDETISEDEFDVDL